MRNEVHVLGTMQETSKKAGSHESTKLRYD